MVEDHRPRMMPYSPHRWQAIESHFAATLHLPHGERSEYLERSCASDPELRLAVERLLQAHEASPHFLETLSSPAVAALFSGEAEEPGASGVVGHYAIERELGRGGMGVVYFARDTRLDRPVALKLLASHLGGDTAARRRFADEARAASAIDHPHIATIYDVGQTDDGTLFIAMAFCEGATLRDHLRRAPLPLESALRVANELADALAAAHARGIVHRDVKPANVIINAKGAAKLLDFGIAKLAGHDTDPLTRTAGTVAYMSPEQTRHAEPAATQDVWAFGVTMYEALTGTRPFTGDDERAIAERIRHAEPVPLAKLRPELPAALVHVIERCLAKAPAERFADGSELADALRAVPPVPRRETRSPALWYAGTAVLLLLAAAAAALPFTRRATLPANGTIAVLPFSASDETLRQLGSDMVVMLSANLDGVGELRTVDAQTILAQVRAERPFATARDRAAFARQFGAGRVLHGTLVRAGAAVRADVAVSEIASGRTLARASATAAAGDLVALTDSVTWSVLPQLHADPVEGKPQAGVLMTRSVEALRAFLEGERLVGEGRMRQAPEAFARAFAADSTFWLAYWRYAQASGYWGTPIDAEVHRTYREHRGKLPLRDRLLIESQMPDSASERLERLRDLMVRFPDYWHGWWTLGERLTHETPHIGTTRAEAAAAMEQVIRLNPGHVLAWQHLMWFAFAERDSTQSGRVLARLTAMRFDSVSNAENGVPALPLYRFLHASVRRGGRPDPALAREAVRGLSGFAGQIPHDDFAAGASEYGLHEAQIELSRQLTAMPGVPIGIATSARRGVAIGHAGRGAWNDALLALKDYARHAEGDAALLHAYRLAAFGEFLGGLPERAGAEWGDVLERRRDRLPDAARAELDWWRGILAARRGDRGTIAEARASLATSAFRFASLLDRSLLAFDHAIAGDSAAAAAAILALERERGQRRLFVGPGNTHPYLGAVNRLAGSHWLRAAGDTAGASELLNWHEAVIYYGPNVAHANAVAAGWAYQQRAAIEEARGQRERAVALYRLFLHRLDRPSNDADRAAVEHARRVVAADR